MNTYPRKLSGAAIEALHRADVMPIFLRDGFVPFLPEWDEGIDFVLYREFDDLLIKVQQKSRWTINRKYENRELAIAFPHAGSWYLAPHSELVLAAKLHTNFLNSKSWAAGEYSTARPSPILMEQMRHFQLGEDNSSIYAACGATRVFIPYSGETSEPVRVEINNEQLWVWLRDGRTIVTPIWWYPEVADADSTVQNNVELSNSGLHWPDLDADYSIAGMLRGSMHPRVRGDCRHLMDQTGKKK